MTEEKPNLPVPVYRLLYFSGHRLERAEQLKATTALEAIEEAAKRPNAGITELWSPDGRLAVFRPAGRASSD